MAGVDHKLQYSRDTRISVHKSRLDDRLHTKVNDVRLVGIERLAAGGESETLEFKTSTGELREAAEALCAFLNAHGGDVFIGVTPAGRVIGQQVSDRTQQDIANTLRKIEPPVPVEMTIIDLPDSDKQMIVLSVAAAANILPFIYDGRPYQRVGTTTTTMPQERYQQLLLQRLHSRNRWENTSAIEDDLTLLDTEEILRTARLGIEAGRLPETTGTK
jgi:ATP-dependent DNA helicase RecG